MKKCLVLSDPLAAPGYSPRVRYLCDYLVQRGHDVTLLTEEYQPLPFEHSYTIIPIKMYTGKRFDWFIKTGWTLLTDWHNRAFAKKSLQMSAISRQPWDLVICSPFGDFPLGAAKRIADHFQIPLICDIRDIVEQVDNSTYQYKHQSKWLIPFRRLYCTIHICRRNKVLCTADAVTTISPWHAQFIQAIRHQSSSVSVIYNGFDDKQFYPQVNKNETFVVSYIGSLFDWQKPALEKVEQAIEELNQSLKNQKSKILWEIHTPQKDPIPYHQMGGAIRKSGVMLVLTATHTHGMLTTKFYEALGCEKPILCVPSDNGSLAELISYTNAGLATDDIEQIKQFIMDQYEQWTQTGVTRQQTLHREEFSRHAQIAKLEQLIEKIC